MTRIEHAIAHMQEARAQLAIEVRPSKDLDDADALDLLDAIEDIGAILLTLESFANRRMK